jgi:GNAT superfamily N-acetyltransferase
MSSPAAASPRVPPVSAADPGGSFRIRAAHPGDRDRIVDLLLRSGHASGSRAEYERYWTWKHEMNPFGRSLCLLAEAGGDLAGVRAFLRWQWMLGPRPVSALRAVDTITAPELRRMGIFSALTRAALERGAAEGHAFVFNTPNSASLPGYLKLGWQRVTRLPLWIRCGPRVVRALVREGISGTRVHASAPPDLSGFERASALVAAAELERLASQGADDADRLRTPRTAEYLTWRYAQAPGLDYRIAADLTSGRDAALIFRGRTRQGFAEIDIAEVFVSRAARSVRAAAGLLRQVTIAARPDLVVGCARLGSAEGLAFLAAGFLYLPRVGPILVARHLNDARPPVDPTKWAGWRGALGDFEVF